jgi:predicted RNA-binding protein YlxR (DUF448 family)/ribosomal protein L7Ae-like RNA K-turn-binding protein
MSEAAMLLSEATTASEVRRAGGRTRTCVGCNERVEILSAGPARLIRFILGPGGEVAVDPKGGGFGRGAHVHPRRECVERAARAGLLRATKGAARTVVDAGESGIAEPLAAAALARAIQRSMDRRVEGLLATAVRSRQLARGADAVTGACQRGEAALVVVACDAAAAADLTEVRRAVAEGRAVAWGTKERLGAIVAPRAVRSRLGAPPEPHGTEGVGVVAIVSRTIAEALQAAVQAANAVTSVVTMGNPKRVPHPPPKVAEDRPPRRAKGRKSEAVGRRDGAVSSPRRGPEDG